jgi:hypothetical protein
MRLHDVGPIESSKGECDELRFYVENTHGLLPTGVS